MKIKWSANNYR